MANTYSGFEAAKISSAFRGAATRGVRSSARTLSRESGATTRSRPPIATVAAPCDHAERDQPLGSEPRLRVKLLEAEVTLLNEMLAAMRASRDSWRTLAEKLAVAAVCDSTLVVTPLSPAVRRRNVP